MLCDFVTFDGINFKCKNCGVELRFTEYQLSDPVFVCNHSIKKNKNEAYPSFVKKIKNFATAVFDHLTLGMPMATEETIEKRYEICLNCENFSNNSCRLCGCALNRNKKFVSKLAWADQKCPINKW